MEIKSGIIPRRKATTIQPMACKKLPNTHKRTIVRLDKELDMNKNPKPIKKDEITVMANIVFKSKIIDRKFPHSSSDECSMENCLQIREKTMFFLNRISELEPVVSLSGEPRLRFLKIRYYDFDARYLSEAHFFKNPSAIKKFNINFSRSNLCHGHQISFCCNGHYFFFEAFLELV